MNKLHECPLCGELYTTDEWNRVTLNACISRQERRKYIPFESSYEKHKNRRTGYKCPGCLEFIGRLLIKESKISDDEIMKTPK